MKVGLFVVSLFALVFAAMDLHATERIPVVVELFTSEGCSSCPPADALLASLAREQSSAVEIVALGEHVDYWNELGWKDRFSSHQSSQRQEEYARRFRLDSVYTPQMVIDGNHEFVGNDSARAHNAIAAATRTPKPVQVTLENSGGALNITLIQGGNRSAVVLLAVTEDNLVTEVRAGENGGRRLVHQAVVRSLRQIGTLSGATFTAREVLQLEPSWQRRNLRVVVFAQDRSSGAVLGAASRTIE